MIQSVSWEESSWSWFSLAINIQKHPMEWQVIKRIKTKNVILSMPAPIWTTFFIFLTIFFLFFRIFKSLISLVILTSLYSLLIFVILTIPAMSPELYYWSYRSIKISSKGIIERRSIINHPFKYSHAITFLSSIVL